MRPDNEDDAKLADYWRALLARVDPNIPPAQRNSAIAEQLRLDVLAGNTLAQTLVERVVRRISIGFQADRAFGSTDEVLAAIEAGDLQQWVQTQFRSRQLPED